jgi:hypothetical protein
MTKIFRPLKLFRFEIAFGLGFLVPALPGWEGINEFAVATPLSTSTSPNPPRHQEIPSISD